MLRFILEAAFNAFLILSVLYLIDITSSTISLIRMWRKNSKQLVEVPKKEQLPEVIVIGKGPTIQNQAEYLASLHPKPKFKPITKTSGPSKRRKKAKCKRSFRP